MTSYIVSDNPADPVSNEQPPNSPVILSAAPLSTWDALLSGGDYLAKGVSGGFH
jgi:hypothetical protein